MSIWSRLLNRKSASFGLRKKPAPVNPKPQLLQLEERVVPAGNLVAFVVDGLGGYELKRSPAGTPILDYLNGINSGIGNSLTGTYVYTPDWNSPDSTKTSPDAGYFNVGIKTNKNKDIGINLPGGIDIDVSMGIGGPKDFISDLSNWLEKYTTKQDTVVLIGHSLGGNSILEAAKQTKAEIDFLVTIDPVGFSPEPESATFKANLAGGFLGQLVNFQKTFKNSYFVAPIDDIGYPGYILFQFHFLYIEIPRFISTTISIFYTTRYFFKKIPIKTPKNIEIFAILSFMVTNYIFSKDKEPNNFEQIFYIFIIFDFFKRNFFDKHPMQPEIDKASLPATNE